MGRPIAKVVTAREIADVQYDDRFQKMQRACEELVETIEATGGLVSCTVDGCTLWAPRADPTWGDLGGAYEEACKALGRKPMRAKRGRR